MYMVARFPDLKFSIRWNYSHWGWVLSNNESVMAASYIVHFVMAQNVEMVIITLGYAT